MKSVKIAGTLIIVFVLGCTAVPVSTGNKGLETGDIGFVPHDMGTVKSGGDASAIKTAGDLILRLEGGRIGLTIVCIALAVGGIIVSCKALGVARAAIDRMDFYA